MSETATVKKTEVKFFPKNDNLLCKYVKGEEKVGSLFIPDPDKWQKMAEVIMPSPKLSPFVDDYKVGDLVLYPVNTPEMKLRIDDEDYIIIRKVDVVCKYVGE